MPTRKKIGLIGAGNIGGELARLCANEELGDVFLYDIPPKENFAKGKALDLEQNGAVLGYDSNIRGTANWARPRGRRRPHHHGRHSAQAGAVARRPRRDEPARSSATSASNAKKVCPNAFVIVISNPLDAMVYEYQARRRRAEEHGRRHGGRPRQRALPALPGARGGRQRQGRARRWSSAATATTWSPCCRRRPSTASRSPRSSPRTSSTRSSSARARAAARSST